MSQRKKHYGGSWVRDFTTIMEQKTLATRHKTSFLSLFRLIKALEPSNCRKTKEHKTRLFMQMFLDKLGPLLTEIEREMRFYA